MLDALANPEPAEPTLETWGLDAESEAGLRAMEAIAGGPAAAAPGVER